MKKEAVFEQFLLYTLLALVAFGIDTLGLIRPVRRVIEAPVVELKRQVFKLESAETFITSLRTKNEELGQLRAEIIRLSSLSGQLAALSAENAALKTQLGLGLPAGTRLLETRPIGLVDGQMTIDIGRAGGVAVGDTLSLGQLLVGRVVSVSESQSLVRLPTAEDEKITVVVRETASGIKKAAGLVVGQGSRMVLEKVTLTDALNPGDLIMTAGEGYARDLVVGRVGKVLERENQLFKKAEVIPVVDFPRLERAFIIK